MNKESILRDLLELIAKAEAGHWREAIRIAHELKIRLEGDVETEKDSGGFI
jgi:rubrerythrin